MANGENCPGCADQAAPISGGHEPWHRHLADGPAAPISGSGNRMVAFKPLGPLGPTVYRAMTGIAPEHMARLGQVSFLHISLGGSNSHPDEVRGNLTRVGAVSTDPTSEVTHNPVLPQALAHWGRQLAHDPVPAERPSSANTLCPRNDMQVLMACR